MSLFRKRTLLTPGPTMVPPIVTEARAKQLPHHRTPEFMQLIQTIHTQLQYLFATSNNVYSISASGSGAMEACVSSLLSPGDKAICIDGGKFGQRWVEMCEAYEAKPVIIELPRGEDMAPDMLREHLKAHPDCKAVFGQLVETSTGVTYDVKALGKVVAKTDAVFVVDSISGLGAEPFYTDDWHVDIAIGGSQKGTMLPPGLAFLSISDKAWTQIERSKNRRYYLDLRKYHKGHDKGEHPFTPAVGLYIQLGEVLNIIERESREGMWRHYKWLSEATKAGVEGLGLSTFSTTQCNVLTSVNAPQNIDVGSLLRIMRDDLGVTIANGQNELKGKIFRMAHLGYVDRFDILTGISALEIALKRLNYPVEMGAGITAAEKALLNDAQ